jgi:hypothetical protein
MMISGRMSFLRISDESSTKCLMDVTPLVWVYRFSHQMMRRLLSYLWRIPTCTIKNVPTDGIYFKKKFLMERREIDSRMGCRQL